MVYFDTFHSKQPKDSSDSSIKSAIKDHIIWKGNWIWDQLMHAQVQQNLKKNDVSNVLSEEDEEQKVEFTFDDEEEEQEENKEKVNSD